MALVYKFGDNIDTDVIIPARFCNDPSKEFISRHCMYDYSLGFAERVSKGDVIVAGENFGCGSSREAAVWAILGTGISTVIARSFARIFYRNAVNIGMELIECSEIADIVSDGSSIEVDRENRRLIVAGKSVMYSSGISDVCSDIIQAGGLINYINSGAYGENNDE